MIALESEVRERLAVAVANVEAFVDGKLAPTPRRLRAVSESLSAIEALLGRVWATPVAERRVSSVGSPTERSR